MTDAAQRAYCYRCFKPAGLCVCAVSLVRNRTHVVILQHPRERQHPLGTERFARLGLNKCAVHIAWGVTASPELVPPGAALLFPSESARELTTLGSDERPTTLVVLDGTWSQARSLYKKNPWLAALPHVKLTQAPPSNYRIRREPRAHYVSTIEALVHALRALEPETDGFAALLASFDRMVDTQLAYSAKPPGGSYKHGRRTPRNLAPHPLLTDGARTPVVGYTEYASDRSSGRGSIIQVCIERLKDGARFESFVRPTTYGPDDEHLANMGLTRAQLADGVSDSVLAERLRAFVHVSDVLVAWSPSTLRLLQSLTPWPDVLGLKGAYGNFTRSRPGELEALPPRHDITPSSVHFSGRAGTRMAAAVALAAWLRRQRRGD